MKILAKFEVIKVSEIGQSGRRLEVVRLVKGSTSEDRKSIVPDRYESTGVPIREITLSAVYGGSEENESFATSTPTGQITFQLNNPALADEFKPGQAYYVEFTEAPGI
jgi:hypothetical protein